MEFIFKFLFKLNDLYNFLCDRLKWYFKEFDLESWRENPFTDDIPVFLYWIKYIYVDNAQILNI